MKKMFIACFIISVVSGFALCEEAKLFGYTVNGNILSFNKISVDLKDDIDNINSILKLEYYTGPIPQSLVYRYLNTPLRFFVNEKTNKIKSVLFFFHSNQTNQILANKLTIDDLEFDVTMTWEEMLLYLNESGITYTIEEGSSSVKVRFEDSRVSSIRYRYLKDNLLSQTSIQFKLE